MASKYELGDAEERARAFPTFKIPSAAERTTLRVGDYAKVIFAIPRHLVPTRHADAEWVAERMWVQVSAVEGEYYRGKLENEPVFIDSIALGDEIQFRANNIAAVERCKS
jgi:uncharacterized protein YegJ (DUF2314 family)